LNRSHQNRFKVVLPLSLSGESAKYPQKFRELGADFIGQRCESDEDFIALARDADAIITVGSIRPVPGKIIAQLEKCRLISNTQIGYDSIDTSAAAERGILVTNVPDYCVGEVSDHAMALILACTRKVVRLNDSARKGQWGLSGDNAEIQSQVWPRMTRLEGQTLGLFGFGRVARSLAPKARGFGLRIIAHDPYVAPEAAQQMGVSMVEWQRLLNESDFISIHAALTAETRQIFSHDAFNEMKPTACLINTARGGFVDEAALFQALTEGKIAMAALDVMDPEPPDPGSPLFTLENFISTAHSAFFSPDSEAERWHRPVLEVTRVMRGEWPKAIVNPDAKEKYIARWGQMKEPG
jgi:D-3-phosphoglycerate dehydrogenase